MLNNYVSTYETILCSTVRKTEQWTCEEKLKEYRYMEWKGHYNEWHHLNNTVKVAKKNVEDCYNTDL